MHGPFINLVSDLFGATRSYKPYILMKKEKFKLSFRYLFSRFGETNKGVKFLLDNISVPFGNILKVDHCRQVVDMCMGINCVP